MTASELLSARIAHLEATAQAADRAHDRLDLLSLELQTLEQTRERITTEQKELHGVLNASAHARRILDYLAEQTDRVLNGGELMQQPDPIPDPIRVDLDTQPDLSNIVESPVTPEIPTSSAETEAEGPANSESNSESASEDSELDLSTLVDTEPPVLSCLQRLKAWVTTLDSQTTFNPHDAAKGTDMPVATARRYFQHLVRDGVIERVPGTGVIGCPGRYRLPGSNAEEQEPVVAAVEDNEASQQALSPEIAEEENKVTATASEPVQAAKPKATAPTSIANLPRDLPPLTPQPATASALECEQVLGILRQHGRPMSLAMITGRAKGLKQPIVSAALHRLLEQGKARQEPNDFWRLNAGEDH